MHLVQVTYTEETLRVTGKQIYSHQCVSSSKTLKSMIRKYIHKEERNSDKWLNPLLFAVGEVP